MTKKRKSPLRTDDKYIAGVRRIDASPQEIAQALRRKPRPPTQWVDRQRDEAEK